MKKMNVKEIIKEMKENNNYMYFKGEWYPDLAMYFAENDSGYICDIISNVADNNVDIYTAGLLEWIGQNNNFYYIEDAINEFGAPEKFDILQAIRMGQYLCYERAIYNNLYWCIKLAILENIQAEEISEDILERIEEIANEEDNNAQLEDYIEEIDNAIEEEEEEDVK